MEARYNIIFRGEIVEGSDLNAVKQNLARLFKIPAQKVDQLCSGRRMTIKKGVDYQAAVKYRQTLKKAGAICHLEEIGKETYQPPVKEPVAKKEKDDGKGHSTNEAKPTALMKTCMSCHKECEALRYACSQCGGTEFLVNVECSEEIIQKQTQAANLVTRSEQLIRQERYADAKQKLKQAIAVNPFNATAYSNMGGVFLFRRQYAEAIPWLEKALKINPELEGVAEALAQANKEKQHIANEIDAETPLQVWLDTTNAYIAHQQETGLSVTPDPISHIEPPQQTPPEKPSALQTPKQNVKQTHRKPKASGISLKASHTTAVVKASAPEKEKAVTPSGSRKRKMRKRLMIAVPVCLFLVVSLFAGVYLVLKAQKQKKLDQARAYTALAAGFTEQGSYDSAIEHYEKAANMYNQLEEPLLQAITFNKIGDAFAAKESYDSAILYYTKALTMAEQINGQKEIARNHNSIASVQEAQEDYDQAITHYQKALAMYEQNNDQENLRPGYYNLGLLYMKKGKYDTAIDYYKKAAKLYEQIQDDAGLASVYSSLGIAWKDKKRYKTARDYFQKARSLHERLGDKESLAQDYWYVGLTYVQTKSYKQGQRNVEKAVELWDKTGGIPNDLRKEVEKLKELIAAKTSPPKKTVSGARSVLSYNQVMTNLSKYFDMSKKGNKYLGATSDKKAGLEVIGQKNNITEAILQIILPAERPDIIERNTELLVTFLENTFPEWSDSQTWLAKALNQLNTLEKTFEKKEKKLKIVVSKTVGNKKLGISMPMKGVVKVRVEVL